MSQRIYFSEQDTVTIGAIADTALMFLHQTPTRGEYDAWMASFKALQPMVEEVPEADGFTRPTFKEDWRKAQKKYPDDISAQPLTAPVIG